MPLILIGHSFGGLVIKQARELIVDYFYDLSSKGSGAGPELVR
jgi:hypothetical protein